jgi:hypothetical protein
MFLFVFENSNIQRFWNPSQTNVKIRFREPPWTIFLPRQYPHLFIHVIQSLQTNLDLHTMIEFRGLSSGEWTESPRSCYNALTHKFTLRAKFGYRAQTRLEFFCAFYLSLCLVYITLRNLTISAIWISICHNFHPTFTKVISFLFITFGFPTIFTLRGDPTSTAAINDLSIPSLVTPELTKIVRNCSPPPLSYFLPTLFSFHLWSYERRRFWTSIYYITVVFVFLIISE